MRIFLALLTLCGPLKAVAATTAVADLCAPCTSGEQCLSNLCPLDSGGNGICSQPCRTDADCPAAFACATAGGVCAPTTAASCPSPYLAGVNLICQFPADASGNAGLTRSCQAGLICYTNFATDGSTSGVGACVGACSTINGATACPFGSTCCYGTASVGSCMTASSTASFGGCFNLGDVGEPCTDNNRVYCLPGATCTYLQAPTAKLCYDTCDQGLCYKGGTCQSIGGINLCCATDKFVAGNPASCVPAPSTCRRAIGVECDNNDQCRLGLCFKSGTQAACSAPCSADADCSSLASQGAGSPSGLRCQSFGSSKYCWPVAAAAAAPACATAAVDVTPLTSQGGCHCVHNGSPSSLLPPLSLVVCLAVRRRARTKRALL